MFAAVLVVLGTLLTVCGLAGWFAVAANNPDGEDMRIPRTWAAIGRILTLIGIGGIVTGHASLGGAALAAVVLAGMLAVASVLTASPLHRLAPAAGPDA